MARNPHCTMSDKPKLLIVDDDEGLCNQMKWAFVEDFEVLLAEDRPGALQILKRQQPVIVTLDLGLPPSPNQVTEGMECLAEIAERHPKVKVIVITGQDDREHALKAIAQGAYDFLAKPIQLDDLKVILNRAIHLSKLEDELKRLQQGRSQDAFQGMLGNSPQMQKTFDSIRKVAPSDAPVLVLGASGTGKELAARAIHRLSTRRKGPFVAINCGAIPENLLESELFGHEKGAFTGAHAQKPGRVEGARNGTLFLDEVGELPPMLQVKLLRFLQ
ncbi:MAG: sigma 54-interacting transcriptional regulator, partial [Acidobacteriota bacterium]